MFTKIFEGQTQPVRAERFAKIKEAVQLFADSDGKKGLNPKTFNTVDIAQASFTEAELRRMRNCNDENLAGCIRESVAPVNQTLFSDITQLLVNQGIVEAYKAPKFIGDSLVEVVPSSEDNVQIPGIADIPEAAMQVEEDEEFPTFKVGQDYITTPRSVKIGGKIGVTREALTFDRTGQILSKCAAVGDRCAVNRELRILRTVLGIDNTFSRKGVTRATYASTGGDPRINLLASNPLADWKAFDAALQVFNAMRDDRNVPEPIMVTPNTLIVPQNLVFTAARIMEATQQREATATAATQTYGPNPLRGIMPTVVTSPYIQYLYDLFSVAAKTWFWGDPKAAFGYRQVYPLQVIAAAPGNSAEFDRDVLAQYRASERGVPFVKAPWNMLECTVA